MSILKGAATVGQSANGERSLFRDAPLDQDLGLLRAHRERPRGCRAAERSDELAALHSFTSAAMATTPAGNLRPSAFACLRLIISSNFVGVITDRRAGS